MNWKPQRITGGETQGRAKRGTSGCCPEGVEGLCGAEDEQFRRGGQGKGQLSRTGTRRLSFTKVLAGKTGQVAKCRSLPSGNECEETVVLTMYFI